MTVSEATRNLDTSKGAVDKSRTSGSCSLRYLGVQKRRPLVIYILDMTIHKRQYLFSSS
jgi:hypothetical protein